MQKAIKDRVEDLNVTPLGRAYASAWCDYDRSDFSNTDHNYWARVEVVDSGGGAWGTMMVQISCFSRESADKMGIELERMIDLFMDAMRSNDARIQIYDFTVSQSSPTVIAGRYLIPVSGSGKFGEPEGGASNIEPPAGARGKALTYLFRVHPDDYVTDRQRYQPAV